jgi:DNA-binding NtrC family response regulator
LRKILELWGYEVSDPVTSGEDALKAAEIQKPDLIVFDICIRGKVSGIEIADKIYSHSGIPIIFTTGHSDQETKRKARIVRPAGYFVKPLDYDKLKGAIESAFDRNS